MGNRGPKPGASLSTPIDLSTIEELADGDPAAMAELTAMFRRHTGEQIAQARAAIAARQRWEVARVAHTCIGFTSALGLISVVPILRELERAARLERSERATFAKLVLLVKKWEAEFERLETALKQRIGAP